MNSKSYGETVKHDTPAGYVYFVQAATIELIKIGITQDVDQRLSVMRAQSPDKLRVLGVIEDRDPRGLEVALHTGFAHLRSHGEWFRPEPDLLAYIKENAVVRDCDWTPTQAQLAAVQQRFAHLAFNRQQIGNGLSKEGR